MKFSIPHYQQEMFLEENSGNNGFDYELRSSTHPKPYLRIAPLQQFNSAAEALQELTISTIPAFELAVEEAIKSFPGLQKFLIFPNPLNPDKPVIVFDNHNHAFYFWHWAKLAFNLETPLTLIHIDQHKDSRIPASMLAPEDSSSLDLVYEYTNQILNVGNFVPPAIKTGLIGENIIIDSAASVEIFTRPENNYILDLDLDFFAPEFDYIDRSKKLSLIQSLLPHTPLVTIATSPFFMDQSQALQVLKEIFTLPASPAT
jgi:hypothetical protein